MLGFDMLVYDYVLRRVMFQLGFTRLLFLAATVTNAPILCLFIMAVRWIATPIPHRSRYYQNHWLPFHSRPTVPGITSLCVRSSPPKLSILRHVQRRPAGCLQSQTPSCVTKGRSSQTVSESMQH